MSSGYERYINNVIIIIIIIRRTPLKEGQKTPLKPSTDNWEVLYTVKKNPKTERKCDCEIFIIL